MIRPVQTRGGPAEGPARSVERTELGTERHPCRGATAALRHRGSQHATTEGQAQDDARSAEAEMTERNSSRPAPPPLAGKPDLTVEPTSSMSTGTAAAEKEANGGGGSAKDSTDVDGPAGSSPARETEPWHI